MITFPVNEKAKSTLGTESIITKNNRWNQRLGVKPTFQDEIIKLVGGEKFEAFGSNSTDIIPAEMNGFMAALHYAYAYHYPLILSPDDVWLTLSQSFALHVEQHAEKLRKQFVNHEGKKEINYICNFFIKGSQDNHWIDGFNFFADEIKKHIGKKHDLLTANFSTTGIIEKAVSQVVLMDSMKQYFSYKCTTMCGIPEVTLLGTVDDWKSIQTRVRNFAEFEGLSDWIKSLDTILQEFVNTASGNINTTFWDNIYKSQSGGSGGPTVTGWGNLFHLYLQRKEWVINPLIKNINSNIYPSSIDYPAGVSKVPFIWDYYSTEYKYEFLGGFFGVAQNEKLEIRPAIGWAVRPVKE